MSQEASLGIIAVSTALMAVMQIGALIVLARVATQVRDIVATLQKDIRPLIGRANQIAEDAAKTAALASVQAQKIDRLMTDLSRRVDETSAVVQQAIITPAREGMAIVAALKAGFGALRQMRDSRGRAAGVEEEDALFIG
ncbi:MAG TPA: hypothetical protein VFT47_02730 [Vicinamibacterales bacterium]|nr:hypothetical protein [Vicinamibacterales bacterium]